MGRVDGRVAFITGAARGQGRAHAIRLAEEGADIIAVDLCEQIDTVPYPLGSAEDLAETAKAVEAAGRRIVARKADVRDLEALRAVVDEGVAAFGRLDIVAANAGIGSVQRWNEVTPEIWQSTVDINLTGVWHTCVAAIPRLIEAGGGSIVLTSSAAGLKGYPFLTPYVAAKHALVGLARSLANELAEHHIRVNTLHPTAVDTPMLRATEPLFPLLEAQPALGPLFLNTYPVDRLDPVDISNALLFLASDEGRYVTGVALPVDAGNTIR